MKVQKLAIGRLIILPIAMVCIVVAIFFGVFAYRANVDFHGWMVARPMETTIDLSKPGKISVPFQQACGIAAGMVILLDCDIRDHKGNVPNGLLDDLSAVIVITDAEGNEIDNKSLADFDVTKRNGQILLAHIKTFKTGNYTATMIIKNGAPALANIPQVIYAVYLLNGIEQTPVLQYGFVSIVFGVIGLILMLIVISGLIRFNIRRNNATEDI